MKKLMLIVALIIILGGLFYLISKNQDPKDRHIHAGFKVYIDGKMQDFSSGKYMSLILCEEKDDHRKKTKQEIQIEKAHLHGNVGDVVHSEIEGAVWGDLFKNINYKFDSSKVVESYVNDKKVSNILAYSINAYDSVVILVGKSDKKLLKNAVTKEKIREVERETETC